jgi:hypothetical protein
MKHSAFRTWSLVLISLVVVLGIGLALAFSANLATSVRAAAPANPWSEGTFTQPWCVDKYTTQAQWNSEFTYMQNVDMTLWIYQWTGDSKNNTTIYPTHIAGYTQSSAYDQVETALATAKNFGFKVFMGLVFNDAWWQKEGSDRAWLMNEAAEMNAVADELYTNYFSRYPDTFAGWYINWEMDNYAFYNTDPVQKQNMIDALNAVSLHLDSLNPALSSSIAPFFNTKGGATPEQWETFWYDIMSQTSVDVLAMQDGVGVGHATIAQLPEWYLHVCAGVWRAGKQCWTDLENFTGTSHLKPAPTQRIIDQHQAEYPYVDKIITYSFIEAMSPAWGWNPVYYNGYKNYVDSVQGPTPTPEPGGVMHVSNIAMSSQKSGQSYKALAAVTVVDANNAPVSGAIVYGTFSGATSDSVNGVTDANGNVTLTSSSKKGGGTWSFCVDNVTRSGWTYNASANVETCDSITAP